MSDTARREFLKASSLLTLSASLSGKMWRTTPGSHWALGVGLAWLACANISPESDALRVMSELAFKNSLRAVSDMNDT